MHCIYFLSLLSLSRFAFAAPQDIEFDIVDAAPDLTTIAMATGAPGISTYDASKAASSAAAEVTVSPLSTTGAAFPTAAVSQRDVEARAACDPQPLGPGPVPSPDTADSFLSYPVFSAMALNSSVPKGYKRTFVNLNASNSAFGYMGYQVMDKYDPSACASTCNAVDGCASFNIYLERDPTVDPAPSCANPPSTTNIKCVLWGGPVDSTNANNYGQWRQNFQVVIAASNGYVNNSISTPPGYASPTYLGNSAINAPKDCNNVDTYMGAKIFTDGPFDAGKCAAACSAQSDYNRRHPPAPPAMPKTCQFFNTYIMYKNGVPQGQYCSMYTESWNTTYATNTGQYRGSDSYTIKWSYTFSNETNPGYPLPPCGWKPPFQPSSSSSAVATSSFLSTAATSTTIAATTTASNATASASATPSVCPPHPAEDPSNMLLNPSFECHNETTCTHTIYPWTISGVGAQKSSTNGSTAADGTFYVTLEADAPMYNIQQASLSQQLTVSGSANATNTTNATYSLSFEYRASAFSDPDGLGSCNLTYSYGNSTTFVRMFTVANTAANASSWTTYTAPQGLAIPGSGTFEVDLVCGCASMSLDLDNFVLYDGAAAAQKKVRRARHAHGHLHGRH